jgi:ethanolamine transporter EutH
MIQRIIGISLGALATYLLLIILAPPAGNDQQNYITAVVVGALIGLLWPVVIGWYLVRRHKQKNQDQISAEVDRQLAEERAKQG